MMKLLLLAIPIIAIVLVIGITVALVSAHLLPHLMGDMNGGRRGADTISTRYMLHLSDQFVDPCSGTGTVAITSATGVVVVPSITHETTSPCR
jgi:hypothetical protein